MSHNIFVHTCAPHGTFIILLSASFVQNVLDEIDELAKIFFSRGVATELSNGDEQNQTSSHNALSG